MRRLSFSGLVETGGVWDGAGMSTVQVLEEFRALPGEERRRVAEAILMEEDSWIPESFRAGMADIAAGRVLDLEKTMADAPAENPGK